MTAGVTFRPLMPTDVPLLTRWLQAPHVRAVWDDGVRDEGAVRDHYFRAGWDVPDFMLRIDDQAVGFLQTEQVRRDHECASWASSEGETWALDLLACAVLWQTQHPALRRLVIDPDERNVRAVKAYAKAGFMRVGKLTSGEEVRQIRALDPSHLAHFN